jgi:hypothetical protein
VVDEGPNKKRYPVMVQSRNLISGRIGRSMEI